ncbi:MAG TPA: hypothetical protein DIU35_05270 [Candidatus Latescibacteria bacterium]|nr:hypothetical protein [Gemmatimonadota bacterium]HCR16874.1 hypothetical protein [Candidatus Latescibacterota bacterium]|tara:strand:- start:1374 stop:3341 length:1968 start_codon:yes stop_codon:yes gene_type:complete
MGDCVALPEVTNQTEEQFGEQGVTGRSILIGVGVAAAANLWVNFIEYVVHASRLTLSHLPMGALMVYLFLVLLLNPACRWIARQYALSPTELLVTLACGLVGGAIPSVGLTGYFLGAIAAPYYFADPENQWATFFHPYIPEWLAPRNINGTLDHLFEGLPPGGEIPWSVWFVPVVCWMLLVLALFTASVCTAVILRKQWVENERLTYPILRPVMDLTDRQGERFPRLFWIGFFVAFGILTWNMINYFVPGFPKIPNIQWGPWIGAERYFPGVWTRINMFTISFAYFANIDVLFSLWFFDLLFIIRSGLLNRMGVDASGWKHASTDFRWIPLGAFFALVFWSLWTARGHLKSVFEKTIRRNSQLDDSDEMMPYHTAVFGLIGSVLFCVLWLSQAGMALSVSCLFVFATLILYIGVSRIVSDVGLVFVSMPVGAQRFVTSALGSQNLSGSSLTVLAFTNTIQAYGKGLFMPSVTHSAKIADSCPRSGRRGLLAGIFLAFAIGSTVSILYTLQLGYQYGAYNFNDFPFTRYSKAGFSSVLAQMRNPEPVDQFQLSLFGIGAAGMSVLTFLKYRLPWWPLHPIGFALAGTGTSVRYTVFSVFLAWVIKFIILRIGGAMLYRRYRPFFLGVLIGYTAGIGLSLFVDIIWFPGAGHNIHGY